MALYASSQWETWLTWRNAVPFGQTDPDPGTRRRFLRVLASLLSVGARPRAGPRASRCYRRRCDVFRVRQLDVAIRRDAVDDADRPSASVAARGRVSSCCSRSAPGSSQAAHLVQPSGVIYGPGYADVNGRMPAALILAVVCVIGARSRRCRRSRRATGRSRGGRAVSPGRRRRRGLQHAPPALRRHAQRADARVPIHPAQHRRHAPRVRARPGRSARADRRRATDPRRRRRATSRQPRTSGCGTTSRCSTPSASFRSSARITTSCRWTTTGTASTVRCGRSCCRRASSTPPTSRTAHGSTTG